MSPAFAAELPPVTDAVSDVVVDADVTAEEAEITNPAPVIAPTANTAAAPVRSATGRASLSRFAPNGASDAAGTSASSRATAARSVAGRGTTANSATVARTATRATAANSNSNSGAARGGASYTNGGVSSRVGLTTNNTNTAGVAARPSANNGASVARASVTQTGMTSAVRTISSRVPTIRVASNGLATDGDDGTILTTTNEMDELAQMTDYCKAQYTQCMDNFCNVLDDNQGRCSCSANLKNYSKTEDALKAATAELQEVAQKIQYIGLTKDEIETLFTQTEAEAKMQSTTDTTQLKNDLDKIKKMIVDVQAGTVSTADTGISLDLSNLLDFTIDSTGFDLSALFSTSNNATSISNQRGETLYKTASARCKAAVLNSCTAQGVDASIITNSYDLEIDKQCIVYERSLIDSNDQMIATVRNAKSVLQKARLLVEQQKNQYDMRGCINALDSCMQDEFVCGSDYENCLDPTGKYIVNGAVVVGSTPGFPGGEYDTNGKSKPVSVNGSNNGTVYASWDYTPSSGSETNAWSKGSLGAYIDAKYTATYPLKTSATNDMLTYIRHKIGNIDTKGTVSGMCAPVLNRCQNYSYTGTTGNRKYNEQNEVIRTYMERVLVQIKAKQDAVLNDYAESCISDVASCLSQNTYNYAWTGASSSITGEDPSDIAIKACMGYITSCMSVTLNSASINSDVKEWLDKAVGTCYKDTTSDRCKKN